MASLARIRVPRNGEEPLEASKVFPAKQEAQEWATRRDRENQLSDLRL